MRRQLFVGLPSEGDTDNRFLYPVIEKLLVEMAYDCRSQIDVDIKIIDKVNSKSFIEQVSYAAKWGFSSFGIDILCVHADADGPNSQSTFRNKINPAMEHLKEMNPLDYCQIMAPLVPVYETEAWLLADKQLFKEEIGTTLPDDELGINRSPESIANPKEILEEAIRTSRQHLTKRRRRELTLSELYLPIGQSVELDKLRQLASFNLFEEHLQSCFKELNLL